MLCITPHIDDDDGALTLALSRNAPPFSHENVSALHDPAAQNQMIPPKTSPSPCSGFFLPALILAWLEFTFLPGPRSSFSSFSFSCVITHQPVSSIDRSTHTHTRSQSIQSDWVYHIVLNHSLQTAWNIWASNHDSWSVSLTQICKPVTITLWSVLLTQIFVS